MADAALAAGGEVIGVVPDGLFKVEAVHRGLTRLHVTKDLLERKALMASLSDGFISLPGGIGTLDEFFEMWTWTQLGVHGKRCAILNTAGYYDPFLAFLDQLVERQFLDAEHRATLITHDAPQVLLDAMLTG